MNEMPTIYTVDEAAQALRVSRGTVLRYIYAGQLKGAKIGKYWRITSQALNDFVQTGTEPNYMQKLPRSENPGKRTPRKKAEPTE